MVLGEDYIIPHRTPPWETECKSRLTHTGLQRLINTPCDLPSTSGQAGPILNRHLCVTHKFSAPQLENGPIGNSIDVLSIPWGDHHPYRFPPFSLLSHCLEKINRENVGAVVIAPVWCNQVWYPLLLQTLQDAPMLLSNTMDIILSPLGELHPLVQEGHLPPAT